MAEAESPTAALDDFLEEPEMCGVATVRATGARCLARQRKPAADPELSARSAKALMEAPIGIKAGLLTTRRTGRRRTWATLVRSPVDGDPCSQFVPPRMGTTRLGTRSCRALSMRRRLRCNRR